MPGGKYLPCCAYSGTGFDTREEMTEKIGGAFLRDEVPRECLGSCQPNQNGWRDGFARFDTDYKSHQIKYLDFRNNNLCNMKCRSCGPGFSTSWASEAKQKEIVLHESALIDDIDLSQCEQVYFAGGEPLLNPQHYAVLEKLIAQGSQPVLMYSTNTSVLGYKDKHVKDYWPNFDRINVHSSIDAVGQYAEVVRSGTVWADVDANLTWLRSQPNVLLRIATVISAINIWFLPSLLEYFDWLDDSHVFEPVLANVDSVIGLGSIPYRYREPLLEILTKSRFNKHYNMLRAIDALREKNYNQENWYRFLSQQLIQDNYRNENWFDLLPIKHEVYREAMQIGNR
jgi:sulfatase maturation enzyme AslB (radical SAM superfamily)